MDIINLKNIKFIYHQEIVLNNISFSIKNGEKISIIGKSGSGKSTLLKIISKILSPNNGEVNFQKNTKISFLFQENSLLPWKTIKENLYFFNNTIDDNKIKYILDSLEIKKAKDMYPHMLSGGMLQRANIALCLCSEPNLLLMDEPFSSLDYLTKINNYKFVLSLIENGNFASIMVTHDINEALLFSNKIYILSCKTGDFIDCIEIKEKFKSIELLTSKQFLYYHNLILKKFSEN